MVFTLTGRCRFYARVVLSEAPMSSVPDTLISRRNLVWSSCAKASSFTHVPSVHLIFSCDFRFLSFRKNGSCVEEQSFSVALFHRSPVTRFLISSWSKTSCPLYFLFRRNMEIFKTSSVSWSNLRLCSFFLEWICS